MAASIFKSLKSNIPSWLSQPQSATDGLKIAGLVTAGITAIAAAKLLVIPIISLRIQEYPYKYNHYSNSYDIVNEYKDDLKGKIVVITGCNTGIGKETAKQLYGVGCIVIMACRNLTKANNARQDILNEMGSSNANNLIIIRLDLGDLKTIDEFVTEFKANKIANGKIDFLINNAGIMALPEYGVTKDGIERQFGVNHIGHFYLTNKLLPILKQNKTRIVNLSSLAQILCKADVMRKVVESNTFTGPVPDKIPYTMAGFTYYGISKLSNVLFTRQLNRLYHKDGITSLCLHPGAIKTDLERSITNVILQIVIRIRVFPREKTIAQGASTTLRCVTMSNKEIYNGDMDDIDNMALYFDDCRPQNNRLNKDFRDGKNAEIDQALWDYSIKVIQSLDYLKLNDA